MPAWQVLFSRKGPTDMHQVAQEMTSIPLVRVLDVSDGRVDLQAEDIQIRIHYEGDEYVLQESDEIACQFAKRRSDREKIGRCNRRFTIYFEPEEGKEFMTSLILIDDTLEKLVGGVTFDPSLGEFLTAQP